MTLRSGAICAGALLLASCGGGGGDSGSGGSGTPLAAAVAQKNSYRTQTFVANDSAAYHPTVATNAAFIDAWGVAIRPAGIPGHFWVVAGNKSYEYVGDVTGKTVAPCTQPGTLCPDLAPLPTNEVSFPDFPLDDAGRPDIVNNHATGVVFNVNPNTFVITQTPTVGTDPSPITSNARFLFVTSFGAIYAWTERKHADGTFDRSAVANKVFDSRDTGDGGLFYGVALSPSSDRLYVADFGPLFSVRVFGNVLVDGRLQEITASVGGFRNPFAANPAAIKANDFVPWNVQVVGNSVFVAYAKVQQDPAAPVGTPFPGNEIHAAGAGRLAEFDLNGNLVAVWADGGLLDAPWGLAVAPSGFGALSGTLLVGNFGDYDGINAGGIVAFDRSLRKAVNFVRAPDGSPLLAPGIWGMTFGNGDAIGDADALYFASGPNGEIDGSFASLRYAP